MPETPRQQASPGAFGGPVRLLLIPLLFLSGGCGLWVVAREVVLSVRNGEAWSPLPTAALAYVVIIACTAVWLAFTLWLRHPTRLVTWLWATLLPLPAFVVLAVSLLKISDWGGSLDADFGQGVAFAGALLVVVGVEMAGLAPWLARRQMSRRRREEADGVGPSVGADDGKPPGGGRKAGA